MRLTKQKRQDLIDDYLHSAGRNMFLAPEFVSWLSDRPDHPAYGWFEWDDEKAGHSFRVDQARDFVAGLRVSFSVESKIRGSMRVSMREAPYMISPEDTRGSGGGYVRLDRDDPASMDAYCGEGARALEAWCRRYETAVLHRGGNLDGVRKLIALLQSEAAEAA